jgi:hypothetical protein
MAERPSEGAGRRNRLAGPTGQKPGKEGKPFFFFSIFQSHFPKDFKLSFVFEVDHLVQKLQCSSMSAQSYI